MCKQGVVLDKAYESEEDGDFLLKQAAQHSAALRM